MTTTITLPDYLAVQLQHRAAVEQRSLEALAIAYIETGLITTASPPSASNPVSLESNAELLDLVARIKAAPPNPASITPAKGQLAQVLRELEALDMGDDYDLHAEMTALDAAEAELRAINRADDLAEGRG